MLSVAAQTTNTNLKLFGISSKSLKEYITTEKDIRKGFNRMPKPCFLLQKEKEEEQSEENSIQVIDEQLEEEEDFQLSPAELDMEMQRDSSMTVYYNNA